MGEPPITALQASVLACSVLATSQDEFALQFVSVYFARTISVRWLPLFDMFDLNLVADG